jgi:hypothetical protein
MQSFWRYFTFRKNEEHSVVDREPGRKLKMFRFDNLPTDIFYVVRMYVTAVEFRRFMNANKRQFDYIRKYCNHYNFNIEFSKKYLTDDEFRNRIQSKVKPQNHQISLSFTHDQRTGSHKYLKLYDGLYKLRFFDSTSFDAILYCKNIKHLVIDNGEVMTSFPKMENIERLELRNFYRLQDIRELNGIPHVSLINFHALEDVAGLEDCDTLHFDTCTQLSEIGLLGKQTKITFLNSPIMDVSSLFQVPHLHFQDCWQLTNIDCLNSCHSLTVRNCRFITHFPALTAVCARDSFKDDRKKVVFLENPSRQITTFCHSTDHNIFSCTIMGDFHFPLLSLKNIHKILLQDCENVYDVSDLGNVPSLSLSSLRFLRIIDGLGQPQQKEVILTNCPHVKHFHALQSIPKVEVNCCPDFHSIVDVKHVSSLKLKLLPKLNSVHGFSHQHSLKFICIALCNHLTSLAGLEEVPVIEVMDCGKLHDFSSLGKLPSQKISFYGCPKIEKIGNLKGIESVKIQNCPNVKDIREMGRNFIQIIV